MKIIPKYIFVILMLTSGLYASKNYILFYHGIKVGKIENMKTLDKNYVDIKVINKVARFLLGEPNLTFYKEGYVINKNLKDRKYKRDKHLVIDILNKAMKNDIKEGKVSISKDKAITLVKINKYKYNYEYVKKNKIKSYGEINLKDNVLESLIDKKNNVKIEVD